MNADEMITQIRDEAVFAAIRDVETHSSGEVRVFITSRPVEDSIRDAWAAFAKLKMQETRQRNAALVFIAPVARKFAIIGDEGLNRHCPEVFWSELASGLAAGFREGAYTEALTNVIQRIGEVLALHFPPHAHDHNELPDDIVRE
jgi:uncharacterized membrane protein